MTHPHLTPELIQHLADDFCAHSQIPIHITNYAAFPQLAACCGAKLHGVPIFLTPHETADYLALTTSRLAPLSSHNDVFGRVLRDTYLALTHHHPLHSDL